MPGKPGNTQTLPIYATSTRHQQIFIPVKKCTPELGYAKLAIRCAVAMVDQGSGVKAGPEPIRTLAAYRRTSCGGVAFGAKFSVLRAGKLTVADEVTVISWADPEL